MRPPILIARLALALLLSAAGLATAAPSAKVVSAYDQSKRAQLIEWIEQLRSLAAAADAKAAAAEASLGTASDQRARAEASLLILQADIDKLRAWGVEQQALYQAEAALRVAAERDRDAERTARHAILAKYHRAKFYVGSALAVLAGGLAALLIFRFAAPALNTVPGAILAFGAPTAVGAATFAAVFILL